MLGQGNKAVTVPPPAPDSRADRTTTTKPTELLHPSRGCSTGLPQGQQHRIMPDEAHKALQAVIGYCAQQPTGFLGIKEGVLLGKLDERLRCFVD